MAKVVWNQERWVQRPRGLLPRIDWANPLTGGLIAFIVPVAGYSLINLATRRLGVRSGDAPSSMQTANPTGLNAALRNTQGPRMASGATAQQTYTFSDLTRKSPRIGDRFTLLLGSQHNNASNFSRSTVYIRNATDTRHYQIGHKAHTNANRRHYWSQGRPATSAYALDPVDTAITWDYENPGIAVASWNFVTGNHFMLHPNGVKWETTIADTATNDPATTLLIRNDGGTGDDACTVWIVALWSGRSLSDREARIVRRNPWALLEPNASSVFLPSAVGEIFPADPGALSMTGAQALASITQSAQPGSMGLVGADAEFGQQVTLPADPGTLGLTGNTALFPGFFDAAPGAMGLVGEASTVSLELVSDPTALGIAGANAGLDVSLDAATGALSITGAEAFFGDASLDAEPGTLSLLGGDAQLGSGEVFSAEPGTIGLVGASAAAALFSRSDPGAVTFAGADADFVEMIGRLDAEPGLLRLVGGSISLGSMRSNDPALKHKDTALQHNTGTRRHQAPGRLRHKRT